MAERTGGPEIEGLVHDSDRKNEYEVPASSDSGGTKHMGTEYNPDADAEKYGGELDFELPKGEDFEKTWGEFMEEIGHNSDIPWEDFKDNVAELQKTNPKLWLRVIKQYKAYIDNKNARNKETPR